MSSGGSRHALIRHAVGDGHVDFALLRHQRVHQDVDEKPLVFLEQVCGGKTADGLQPNNAT
jgi:hypothetical protein